MYAIRPHRVSLDCRNGRRLAKIILLRWSLLVVRQELNEPPLGFDFLRKKLAGVKKNLPASRSSDASKGRKLFSKSKEHPASMFVASLLQ